LAEEKEFSFPPSPSRSTRLISRTKRNSVGFSLSFFFLSPSDGIKRGKTPSPLLSSPFSSLLPADEVESEEVIFFFPFFPFFFFFSPFGPPPKRRKKLKTLSPPPSSPSSPRRQRIEGWRIESKSTKRSRSSFSLFLFPLQERSALLLPLLSKKGDSFKLMLSSGPTLLPSLFSPHSSKE